jgi:tetratricopeptide (TPR) repeat protein
MAKKIKPPRDKEEEKRLEAEAKAKEVADKAGVVDEQKAAEAEAAAAEAVKDEFQVKGFELVDWVHENQATVMGFLGAVVLAGLGYGIYTVVDKSGNTEASAAWVSALDIWEAPVGEDSTPDDGKTPYKTADEKFKAARTAFEGVTTKYDGRGGSTLSYLYVGHAALKQGDHAAAITAYQKFLDGTKADDNLRFAGFNGLAAAKEASGDVKGAIEALEDLVALADKVDEDAALLGLGRLYQKDGDVQQARKRLEVLVADYPESSLKARADELLASLGAAPVAATNPSEKPTP